MVLWSNDCAYAGQLKPGVFTSLREQARNPENSDLDCTAAIFLLDAATARSMTE